MKTVFLLVMLVCASVVMAQNPTQTPPSIEKYEGEKNKDGLPYGKGKATYSNGDIYEGDFVEGKFQGKGVYKFSSGEIYEGDFVEGKRHGKGVYKFSNGDIYEGDFVEGKLHGKGVFKLSDGNIYEGDFVEGKIQGKGVYKFSSGEIYEGDFVEGKLQGKGVFVYPDGTIRVGNWFNNHLEGKNFILNENMLLSFGVTNNDEEEGEWVFYNPNGSIGIIKFEGGKIQGESIQYHCEVRVGKIIEMTNITKDVIVYNSDGSVNEKATLWGEPLSREKEMRKVLELYEKRSILVSELIPYIEKYYPMLGYDVYKNKNIPIYDSGKRYLDGTLRNEPILTEDFIIISKIKYSPTIQDCSPLFKTELGHIGSEKDAPIVIHPKSGCIARIRTVFANINRPPTEYYGTTIYPEDKQIKLRLTSHQNTREKSRLGAFLPYHNGVFTISLNIEKEKQRLNDLKLEASRGELSKLFEYVKINPKDDSMMKLFLKSLSRTDYTGKNAEIQKALYEEMVAILILKENRKKCKDNPIAKNFLEVVDFVKIFYPYDPNGYCLNYIKSFQEKEYKETDNFNKNGLDYEMGVLKKMEPIVVNNPTHKAMIQKGIANVNHGYQVLDKKIKEAEARENAEKLNAIGKKIFWQESVSYDTSEGGLSGAIISAIGLGSVTYTIEYVAYVEANIGKSAVKAVISDAYVVNNSSWVSANYLKYKDYAQSQAKKHIGQTRVKELKDFYLVK